MILRLILFIVILILLCAILFFLSCILIPAISEQTKISADFVFSKFEHNLKKIEDSETKQEEKTEKKAVVLCSCKKSFSKKSEVYNKPGLSCAVIAKEYGSVEDCNFMCIGKGDCELVCPQNAIVTKNNTAVISDFCIGCGKCVSVCPKGLIKIVDKSINKILLCSNNSQKTTSCSMYQKDENIEEPVKKYFKIWQSCYRMIDGKK